MHRRFRKISGNIYLLGYISWMQLKNKVPSSASSAGKMTSSSPAGHILVVPFPAQGHLIPLIDLTHHLLNRHLTVTILVTPGNLPLIQPLLSAHPPDAVAALVLPFPPHPSLPAGAENNKDLPPNSTIPLMSTLRRLHRPLLRWFTSHPSPPSAILSDVFLGWTHHLAAQLRIKSLTFWCAGAFGLSVVHHLWKHLPTSPEAQNAVVPIDDVPGQPGFVWSQLSPLYRAYASGDPDSEFLKRMFSDNMGCWGFVLNTFTRLDHAYLTHLGKDLGHDRIWAVGPLFPPESELEDGPKVRGGSGPVDGEVLSWLDECEEDGQVVYVCFGSQSMLTNEHIEVLAFGLERSGVQFVWKIKEPNKGHVDGDRYGTLPPGFEDRVAGRGLVIRGWAPQMLILRHRAVGAFLTHCGWNSMIEGLSAGVMMLTWPLDNDQFSNATLLVDQLKVGVRVGEATGSLPDPNELARTLAGLICAGRRSRALELSKEAAEAISEGGSSFVALDSLVHHLSNLPPPDEDSIRECKLWVEKQEAGDDE